jgi:hypothetical protein
VNRLSRSQCVICLRKICFWCTLLSPWHHVMRVFSRFIQAHPICIEFSLISFNYERVCVCARKLESCACWAQQTEEEAALNKSGAAHWLRETPNPFSRTNPQTAETERNVAEYLCQTAARCLICFDLRVYPTRGWIIHQDGYLWLRTTPSYYYMPHYIGFRL